MPLQPSLRAYPSARSSKTKLRPRGDVIPATAKPFETVGSRRTITASSSAVELSPSCTERSAACPAASADEQAVS